MMRRRPLLKGLVSVAVCGMMMCTACSTAWIGEAEQIVAALIPGIANLLTLVTALQGRDVPAGDLQTMQSAGSQAEADLELIKSLIAQYQKAEAAEQPGLLNQIQGEVSTVQSNLSEVLPALHIKDAATQEKLTAVVGVLLAEVESVAAILPRTSQASPRTARMLASSEQIKAPLTAKEFIGSYNKTMAAKTGEAELDRTTSGLKIHLHGKFARWATAGWLK